MEDKKIILDVQNLVKKYGAFEAVKGISFQLKKGEFFAFLGPNGAGKSTTINTICTIIDATSGEVIVDQDKLSDDKLIIRKSIGLVFQENVADGSLTVYENLKTHCDLYNVPKEEVKDRILNAVKIVQLEDKIKVRVAALSGGMKRRVEVAKGILHNPKILFLDEPTAGLDPQTRLNMWNFLMELKDKTDMTIFLTTHHMDEAEQCDRIAIMDHGKLISIGTPVELKEKYGDSKLILRTKDSAKIQKLFKDRITLSKEGNETVIKTQESLTSLVKEMIAKNIDINDLQIKRPTLNDVFLNVAGRELRDE